MTLDYTLSKSGFQKSIYLCCNDKEVKQEFSLRIPIRILENDWDIVKQRPKDIYKKRFKIINHKLNLIKIHLLEYFNTLEAKKNLLFVDFFTKKLKTYVLKKRMNFQIIHCYFS